MNYKKIMLVTFMLLAILTIGAVSATDDIASDELAASDEAADVQLPQEDFDDLSTDNSAMVYTHDDEVDEGEVGDGDDDPYNVEIVEEFDVSDQDQTIISIFCPADEQKSYFVFKTLDDDWQELNTYEHQIRQTDKGNVIQFTPRNLGIGEAGCYIILIYCADDPEDLQEDEEIFEAWRGIFAIDYTQFRYISIDTFQPNVLFMGDIFAVYCPDGSSGRIIVEVENEDEEIVYTSSKTINDNMLYWTLSDLNITEEGRYIFTIFHRDFNSSFKQEIERSDVEVVSPINIDQSSYIDSTINGGLVSINIPSIFEDANVTLCIDEDVIFDKSLNEFAYDDEDSPFWRYAGDSEGIDENYKWYYIYNYHIDYDFLAGYEYEMHVILTINEQSGYNHFTRDAQVRMIGRNVQTNGGVSIEIFGDNCYPFEDWSKIIVITAPEGSEGTVRIYAEETDWAWEGSLEELSGFENGEYWVVPDFIEDLDPGDYEITVQYYDENGNLIVENSAYIEFSDGEGEEDEIIEGIEFHLNSEDDDDEESGFYITGDEVVAYLWIPTSEEYEGAEVTVTVTKNGESFAAICSSDLEGEYIESREAVRYPIALNLFALDDKDLLTFTWEYLGEMDTAEYGIEIDEDTANFHWYEEMVEAYVFTGNITIGDSNDPERMGPHPNGRFIKFSIPDAFNVNEGSVVVYDDFGTIIEKSLDEFTDVRYDYSNLGNSYVISLEDYDLMNLPENRTITFTFNYGSDSLTFKRIRHGDYLAQIVTPDDVAKSYDININEDVMTSEEDIAVDIVGLDANPQSILMDVGAGQFNVYVNDEKVEGLGKLIFDNWIYLSGVLDADVEKLSDFGVWNIGRPLEEFVELSKDQKISVLTEKFASDFPDDITLFRLTSFNQGCPELHISLADLNITDSGEYNIKVTHIPDPPEYEWDPDYLPDYTPEMEETLVLEKTVTVAFKPSPFISAPDVRTQYGTPVNITVNMYAGARGNAWFTVNGKTEKAPISGGVATYTVSDLKYGLYPVEIRYNGNALYAASTINTTLKVNKLTQPIVSVSADNIGFNEDATVIVNVAQKVNGNIHITVNNVTKAAPIANGVATATFSGLERGTYEVTALYKGTANILNKTKTTTFKVVKGTPIISVDAPDAGYGSDAIITVNMGNRANGNVHVTINGVTNKAPISNGVATYTVSGLKRGTYDVSVTYNGNANYNAQTLTATLNVVKGTPITDISVQNTNVGDTTLITVTMANGINGNVKITVNGATERVAIVNGVATLNVTGLKAGTYDISAVFAGNTNFNAQTATASFTVNKISPGITIRKSTVDGSPMITVKMAQDAPGNVRITVNGATYKIAMSSGVASISLPNLGPGRYVVEATYNGNYKYLAETKTQEIAVK